MVGGSTHNTFPFPFPLPRREGIGNGSGKGNGNVELKGTVPNKLLNTFPLPFPFPFPRREGIGNGSGNGRGNVALSLYGTALCVTQWLEAGTVPFLRNCTIVGGVSSGSGACPRVCVQSITLRP